MKRDGDGQVKADEKTQGGGRIRSKKANGALRWVDHKGNTITARAVRGIRPYHMLRTAREQLVAEQAAIAQRFRTDALRQFTTLRRR